jgi:hypothetical protein
MGEIADLWPTASAFMKSFAGHLRIRQRTQPFGLSLFNIVAGAA